MSVNTSQVSVVESQLDEQFIVYMLEIDGRYKSMMKQDRGRVEQWVSINSYEHQNKSLLTFFLFNIV